MAHCFPVEAQGINETFSFFLWGGPLLLYNTANFMPPAEVRKVAQGHVNFNVAFGVVDEVVHFFHPSQKWASNYKQGNHFTK